MNEEIKVCSVWITDSGAKGKGRRIICNTEEELEMVKKMFNEAREDTTADDIYTTVKELLG